MNKTTFPIDKNLWRPSLIPGAVVLVSTVSKNGVPNVAPISWIQMACFKPPVLMLSTSDKSTTAENIIRTKCFGINFVDSKMASRVFGCIKWHGLQRIEKAGFKLVRAKAIKAPLVGECKAHIECRLHSVKKVGAVIVFGKMVSASIAPEIPRAKRERRYKLLDQILFLENGIYGKISGISRVPIPWPLFPAFI